MIHYLCNGKILYNVYVALHESFTSNKPVELYCLDAENDLLDWTKEPESSFDEIMGAHARHLRNKYERLIFMWSGGTDSHTMYNIFKANNIHLDEIIIKHSQDIEGDPYPEWHVQWMMDNCYDKTTVITPWNEYDSKIRGLVVQDENWIFETKGDLLKYGQSSMSSATIEHCERAHNGHHWGIVMGLEKPTVFLENGRWVACQSDRYMRTVMGHDNVECFYVDPLVNLKQSHMAKRALKKIWAAGNNSLNFSQVHVARDASDFSYTAWARCVGRHPELSKGASFNQKTANGKVYMTKFDPNANFDDFANITGEPMLAAKLKLGESTATNYVKGFYNLRGEQKFVDWLNETSLVRKHTLLNTRDIYSKKYDLGD
jgi:hypothetical protein